MPRKAQVGILHTRFATQGSERDNNNNHPIYNGGIVGVHNGALSNDDELFAMSDARRYGQVDSEAAFAALAYGLSLPGEPKRVLDTLSILERIEGTAALAWMEDEDPSDMLHLARLNFSPLVVGWTVNGSLLFASTMTALKATEAALGLEFCRTRHVEEGDYLCVQAGEVVEDSHFTPSWTASRYYRGPYSWVAGPAKTYSPEATRPALTLVEDPKPSQLSEDIHSGLSLARLFGREHTDAYSVRETAITEFFKNVESSSPTKLSDRLHANLRIGQWVKLTLMGHDAVGQVYEMPQTFPHGQYVLRVLVSNSLRPHDVEWVLVSRGVGEFELHENQNLQTPADEEANIALIEKTHEEVIPDDDETPGVFQGIWVGDEFFPMLADDDDTKPLELGSGDTEEVTADA